ncbi:MAG: type II toxin-antitoxin system RelE/ParE family toxin [Candidatus Eisenbacteria bacterium]|nr:type II toxin-antitoxin system RelE/ParE family toxin [Candidatus Eisenbacteria bacterium]
MERQLAKREQAKRDLVELAFHLAVESGSTELADRFLKAADASFARLLQMPGLGAPRASLNASLLTLRMWPIPDFSKVLIFYLETADGIEVVRVLHASRDRERILDDEGSEGYATGCIRVFADTRSVRVDEEKESPPPSPLKRCQHRNEGVSSGNIENCADAHRTTQDRP